MSATELLAGAVETRTVVNPEKILAAFKAQGWTDGGERGARVQSYSRSGDRAHVITTEDGSTIVTREVGGSLVKLARLIGPKKERKPRTTTKKK